MRQPHTPPPYQREGVLGSRLESQAHVALATSTLQLNGPASPLT